MPIAKISYFPFIPHRNQNYSQIKILPRIKTLISFFYNKHYIFSRKKHKLISEEKENQENLVDLMQKLTYRNFSHCNKNTKQRKKALFSLAKDRGTKDYNNKNKTKRDFIHLKKLHQSIYNMHKMTKCNEYNRRCFC